MRWNGVKKHGIKILVMAVGASCIFSCKKAGREPAPPDRNVPADTIYKPSDPATAETIGFFLDNWQPKRFTPPLRIKDTITAATNVDVTITIDMNAVVTKISKYLYGNNSNTWMGQMITEPVLINDIKSLAPHLIRGPGGSISDIYFWNQSDTPPKDVPDSLYDSNGQKIPGGYWYGKNDQNWTLSLDNYYRMLQQTNSEGILTVNYGYARYGTGLHPVQSAAHLAADWVRYDKGRTKYWEIGNENNGSWEAGYQIDPSQNQDGQPAVINGNLYGKHFKIFADSMRKAAEETGTSIFIGAQLLDAPPASWENNTNKTWNQGVLTEAGDDADYFIVHDYFTPYQENTGISDVLSTASTVPARAMNYLRQQFSQYGIAAKPVALTEWNIQATGSMQNVSSIAGLHAAITLGELIKNNFGAACRWDLANGWSNGDDHGLFNIGDEPGGVSKWNPRPAFYFLYYFQKCFGDRMVTSNVSGSDDILCYASSFDNMGAGVVIANKSNSAHNIEINLQHFATADVYYWYMLARGNDNQGFSRKVYVNGYGPDGVSGGPSNYIDLPAYRSQNTDGIRLSAPPYSAIYLQIAREQ